MIWMGVARPKDFVATLNRFPPHYQRLTNAFKRLFVAKSIGKSTGFYPKPAARPFQPAARCRIRHDLATSKQRRVETVWKKILKISIIGVKRTLTLSACSSQRNPRLMVPPRLLRAVDTGPRPESRPMATACLRLPPPTSPIGSIGNHRHAKGQHWAGQGRPCFISSGATSRNWRKIAQARRSRSPRFPGTATMAPPSATSTRRSPRCRKSDLRSGGTGRPLPGQLRTASLPRQDHQS